MGLDSTLAKPQGKLRGGLTSCFLSLFSLMCQEAKTQPSRSWRGRPWSSNQSRNPCSRWRAARSQSPNLNPSPLPNRSLDPTWNPNWNPSWRPQPSRRTTDHHFTNHIWNPSPSVLRLPHHQHLTPNPRSLTSISRSSQSPRWPSTRTCRSQDPLHQNPRHSSKSPQSQRPSGRYPQTRTCPSQKHRCPNPVQRLSWGSSRPSPCGTRRSRLPSELETGSCSQDIQATETGCPHR